jgi:hypothetical protein
VVALRSRGSQCRGGRDSPLDRQARRGHGKPHHEGIAAKRREAQSRASGGIAPGRRPRAGGGSTRDSWRASRLRAAARRAPVRSASSCRRSKAPRARKTGPPRPGSCRAISSTPERRAQGAEAALANPPIGARGYRVAAGPTDGSLRSGRFVCYPSGLLALELRPARARGSRLEPRGGNPWSAARASAARHALFEVGRVSRLLRSKAWAYRTALMSSGPAMSVRSRGGGKEEAAGSHADHSWSVRESPARAVVEAAACGRSTAGEFAADSSVSASRRSS